jgi:hypothetical protein
MTIRPAVRSISFRAALASALALALCCVAPTASDGAAPAPTQPPPPKVPVHPVGPPRVGTPLNPHLHARTATVTPKPKPATPGKPSGAAPKSPRPTTIFRGRNAHGHIGLVRPTYVRPHGLGQIVGTVRAADGAPVRAADGAPVRGAWVRLARLRGGRLRRAAARHTTYTDSAGNFVMRLVKAGRFRAVASRKDLGRAFVLGALSPGGYARVTLQLKGAARRAG